MGRSQAGSLFYLEGVTSGHTGLGLGNKGMDDLQKEQADGASTNNQDAVTRPGQTAQDSMHGHGGRLQENSLLVAHLRRDAKELLFVQQHLFAPSSAEGRRPREIGACGTIAVVIRPLTQHRIYTR